MILFVFMGLWVGERSFANSQSLATIDRAPTPVRDASRSVAMMLRPSAVRTTRQGTYQIQALDHGYCEGHPFRSEKGVRGLFCSSFLVGPRIVMTAGHCLDGDECPEAYFVFGVAQRPRDISENQIYRCRRVLGGSRFANRGAAPYRDFAIIELDRDVTDRTPLLVRGTPRERTQVFAIGHPDFLPLKYSSGHLDPRIPSVGNGNIGDYEVISGMSGGPLLDRDGQVLGVITSGPAPYVTDQGCRNWNRIDPAAAVGDLRAVRDPEATHNPNAGGATAPEAFYSVLVRAISLVREENSSPVVIDRGGASGVAR